MTPTLHIFTARFNPIGWRVPHRHYLDWAYCMKGLGADVTVVECAYGESPFECELPGIVTHIGVRADSWAWTKENLLNIGVARRPDAKYICWSDSDVFPRRKDWVPATVQALQHYHIIQPWESCYDLGPGDSHGHVWRSFCRQFLHGHPTVVGQGNKFSEFWTGEREYPHSGYCWATKRAILDQIGGLFEFGGMGAADHHQAVALLGQAAYSMPDAVSQNYRAALAAWERHAQHAVNGRIGYIAGTIEHRFHGAKHNRQYWDRWQMFLRHQFDPLADLKRNTWGVLEFAGNKPQLELEWDQYLRMRWEDDNGEGSAPFCLPSNYRVHHHPIHHPHPPHDPCSPASHPQPPHHPTLQPNTPNLP
ncbi:MAG: hypothetical protein JO007_01390 [Alphaproteobacteria bacterium]|nr:hypothetical protein [Alphaproteobacteria bacterium]